LPQPASLVQVLSKGKDPSGAWIPLKFERSVEEPHELRIPELRSRADLAHDLRGRGNRAQVVIESAKGKKRTETFPVQQMEKVTDDQGILFSGIHVVEDEKILADVNEVRLKPLRLLVAHVERGSEGETVEVRSSDQIESVDGVKVEDLAALEKQLLLAQAEKREVELRILRLDFFQNAILSHWRMSVPVDKVEWTGFKKRESQEKRVLARAK